MNLPDVAQTHFKKAPLKLVLGQVKFPILLRYSQQDFIIPFYEALRSDYPHITPEEQVTTQISPSSIDSQKKFLWRLRTRDNHWSIVVSETGVTLETRFYSTMDEFIKRFEKVLVAVSEKLEVSDRMRLGLRYLNEIRHPQGSEFTVWTTLLNPSFVGFAPSDLLDGDVTQTLQEIQINRKDGTLAVRHGFLKGVVVAPLPGEVSFINERFYLVDLDYYNEFEVPLSIKDTLDELKHFNDIQYRFFRWILGPTLYKFMEAENDS